MSFLEQLYNPYNGTSDILSATYSVWNILNYISRKYDNKYRYQRGHIRQIQAEKLLELVRGNNKYCEIGFNAGHSSALALLSHIKTEVTVFDLMSFSYSKPSIQLLNESFNSRIKLYEGKSSETLHKACEHKLKCDVIFVDGSHIENEVKKDLNLIKCLFSKNSVVMIDDIQSGSGIAMRWAVKKNKYRILENFGPYEKNHKNNPCMETPYGPLCMNWGFATLKPVI